ncbi:Nn.00g101260.m01.CDS01 [Neocucurbitaria sp. VM-36]
MYTGTRVKRRRSFHESDTSNFRVIDVESGCIRSVALDIRYVTLSYVWGQLPMFKLLKGNFEHLSQERSLDDILPVLPGTIRDAIELVKALGERYLWVDGLCLVQDDTDDVVLGISMMNSIYRGSYFTIVAGSGAHANAGLPGLRGSTKDDTGNKQITREVAPGIHMAVLHSIDWYLSRSTYNERGWTLQELVLPRRTMIFINDQTYFRCQEANWSEDTWADKWGQWLDADDSDISRIPDPIDGFLPSLWAYQKLCEEFSRRHLRSDGDALRALAGVTRPMAAGMETTTVEGLPGYYLDHFILFIASRGDLRRRDRYASFSWVGWEGQIMWPRENFVWYNETESGTTERHGDTENIFRHLRHHRIISWNTLGLSGHADHLSFRPWELPSLLLEVMQQFPNIFPPSTTDTDPLRDERFRLDRKYSGGSGYSGDVPHWDRIPTDSSISSKWEQSSVEVEKSGPLRSFSIKALDLANGQAEFRRLVARMGQTRERMALQNWMACRDIRAREVRQSRTEIGPRPYRRDMEQDLSRFRRPREESLAIRDDGSAWNDRREHNARYWIEQQKKDGEELSEESLNIPAFPPYTVLYFTTISLHLRLGSTPPHQTEDMTSSPYSSPFDRIPATPLLSKTNQIVGSLHPDNTSLLPPPGSTIELLLITRSHTPTVASALFQLESTDESRPMKLFWVLYVVWKEGIAERRGVGQILQDALEGAVEPAPRVKSVLLG